MKQDNGGGDALPLPLGQVHSATNKLGIFLQDACLNHRYIRNRDTSNIVERPERIKAVKVGISAALARLEDLAEPPKDPDKLKSQGASEPDDLAAAMGRMAIQSREEYAVGAGLPLEIKKSAASVDLLDDKAVKFVHGDIEGDVYLENLKHWAKESEERISKGESEIPEGLPQGDLYRASFASSIVGTEYVIFSLHASVCPSSMDAIQGALGTVCEAVGTVVKASRSEPADRKAASSSPSDLLQASRAFVAIRPPGHHCGEDSPSGFCFVNNVVVGAAHAHLRHGINRVIILDIDLHHGNGTQSLIWQINEESYRRKLESKYSGETKPELQVYYGSVHDILSYPCEDGKPELVQAASVSIHGPHGQYIENVHLVPYDSPEQFWNVVYKGPYSRLLDKAEEFLGQTGGPGDDVLVFISCGFDACEHEYPSMSRHQRKVPASFYHRFARDAAALADRYARGRLVSVLEGGYSDRALTSGAMAHICGLVDLGEKTECVKEVWWDLDNLVKATKKGKRGRQSLPGTSEPWVQRTLEILSVLDEGCQYSLPSSRVPPSTRTLRGRKKDQNYAQLDAGTTPPASPPKRRGGRKSNDVTEVETVVAPSATSEDNSGSRTDASVEAKSETEGQGVVQKKLPKVILHVRPLPEAKS
ncbi:Arginase/deacetylase [Gloeophyllum trabeum ATCC 11539]|uniref:Arginase/deacetylase n=1 Tax=Gloeophyllum trabeum (strain ATCC 11539 / FP-39264 / Madison 617) TaxID=670483 RepID=S7PTK3_GLOTA|nr:Arginase/deacetylase [Gloeophyllum trabeum ATCC 11539]EPQ51096.1 Arginase/deacetylase [Gloeophyllum trabeum ATCC 11539]